MNKETVEKWIDDAIGEANFDEPILSAVRYVFSTGGKRLRPLMFIEAYNLGGGRIERPVIDFAVGIECLHQYTLIHDDLPCMDNDDLRRGKPSCHKKFGEATALLTGDALLNMAFSLMLKAATADPKAAEAAYKFSLLSGGAGVIGGQARELFSENIDREIEDIYRKKTCYLISASVLAGGIMGNLPKAALDGLEKYCLNFGFAFQIYDDLMDIAEKGSVPEKSFPYIYGIERSYEEIKIRTKKAIDALTMSGINSDFFVELALKMAGKRE